MGLFDLFKTKSDSNAEKLNTAYKSFKPEVIAAVFPGGIKQAGRAVNSLGKIFGIDLQRSDSTVYRAIMAIYGEVVIHKVISNSSDQSIMTVLQNKYFSFVKNQEIAKETLAYVTLNMNDNTFELQSKDDFDRLNIMKEIYKNMEHTAAENVEAEKENLDDPEYGLVKNKPIYTQGVRGSYAYLESLRTDNGEPLTWNRLGSTSAEGIRGMIDVYEGRLPDGQVYKVLYVNMYGSGNSNSIPQGFKRRSN